MYIYIDINNIIDNFTEQNNKYYLHLKFVVGLFILSTVEHKLTQG